MPRNRYVNRIIKTSSNKVPKAFSSIRTKPLPTPRRKLPGNVFTKIVQATLTKLVDLAIINEYSETLTPVSLLKRYRDLLLTCKIFNKSVRELETEISIGSNEHRFAVWWGNKDDWTEETHGPLVGDIKTYNSFPAFFEGWQIAMLRSQLKVDTINVDQQIKQLGKFYVNPSILANDVTNIGLCCNPDDVPDFLLLLGPFFNRNKTPFQSTVAKKMPLQVFDLEICMHHGDVSMLEGTTLLHSVESWHYYGGKFISSKGISGDVDEWWVWTIGEDLLYAGYAGQRAWVFNAQNKTTCSNRVRKRKRGEERWGSDDDIPQGFGRCAFDSDYDISETGDDSENEPDESMEYGDDYDWDNHDFNKGFRCGSTWMRR